MNGNNGGGGRIIEIFISVPDWAQINGAKEAARRAAAEIERGGIWITDDLRRVY